MKIGIMTHHYINNYGAFLQAYALQNALSEMFPDDTVEIIDYINLKHSIINTCGWFRFYSKRENFKCWVSKIKVPLTFSTSRKKHMNLSKRCYSVSGINKQKYDCIIIGSDEVWNFADSKGNTPVKFGIGIECKNIIAYAPSVGNANCAEDIPDYVIEGINKFKAISARDDLAAELVHNITGNMPQRVLDPTFLTQFPVEKKTVNAKPYLLFYYCERLPEKMKQQIFDYAKRNGLAVYGAGECDARYDDVTVNLTPFEWVDMFRNAEFVFTGTFHGAVFSILNKRQFKVYLTNESRIKKVGALLNELNIHNRNINSEFEFNLEQMKAEIDYNTVYEAIDTKRVQSLEFLRKAIKDGE